MRASYNNEFANSWMKMTTFREEIHVMDNELISNHHIIGRERGENESYLPHLLGCIEVLKKSKSPLLSCLIQGKSVAILQRVIAVLSYPSPFYEGYISVNIVQWVNLHVN
ncbi:hypothetical protein KP509_22G038000 [Ceratopteris richardii]|uniref:Uncharacterized protein n=1 Tax=Ceratopteris richardii TaxID=49495 RepID=A0A8T2S7D8_CERRI|nr:hypothetical protein KP509_22G038000 [Ceratopteris richardii]